MTAQELIDFLSQLDPNTEIMLWDGSWDMSRPIDRVEVEQDGEVIIL